MQNFDRGKKTDSSTATRGDAQRGAFQWVQIHAVIFDLDGLLIDSERISRQCWYQAAEEMGFSIEEFYPRLIGKGTSESDRLLQAAFGDQVNVPGLRRRKDQLFDEAVDRNEIRLKPGAHQLLSQSRANGLKVALATGSIQVVAERRLTGHTIDSYFDVTIFRDAVGRGKPAPDLFLAAATKLDVRPEHCLVFEDSIVGLQAAKAAQMRVVVVPDLVHIDSTENSESVLILKSLSEAAELLPVMPR